MIVFDSFVFVHLPKTGGTFVETVLKRIHCPGRLGRKIHGMRRRFGVTLPLFDYRYREYRKHAQCKYVPEADRDKVILACVRNPLDLYVSHYKFGWWRSHPDRWFAPGSEMLCRAKAAPDGIAFADWVMGCRDQTLWVHDRRKTHPGLDLGWASCEFAAYFCKLPDEIFRAAPDAQAMAAAFRVHAYDAHFLDMQSLNKDLHGFLRERGYPEERIGFILSEPRIYPGRVTRAASDSVDRHFTPELAAEVRQRERLLFALFPELTA